MEVQTSTTIITIRFRVESWTSSLRSGSVSTTPTAKTSWASPFLRSRPWSRRSS